MYSKKKEFWTQNFGEVHKLPIQKKSVTTQNFQEFDLLH